MSNEHNIDTNNNCRLHKELLNFHEADYIWSVKLYAKRWICGRCAICVASSIDFGEEGEGCGGMKGSVATLRNFSGLLIDEYAERLERAAHSEVRKVFKKLHVADDLRANYA